MVPATHVSRRGLMSHKGVSIVVLSILRWTLVSSQADPGGLGCPSLLLYLVFVFAFEIKSLGMYIDR